VIKCSGVSIQTEPATLASGTKGEPYPTTALSSSGGVAPYSYGVYGSLPAGMSISNGVLSGTPTEVGTFPFSVTAIAANGCPGITSYNFEIVCGTINATAAATTSPICSGSSTTITLTGASGTIQWQSSANSGGPFIDIPGQSAATLNTGSLTGTTYFRAMPPPRNSMVDAGAAFAGLPLSSTTLIREVPSGEESSITTLSFVGQ
jgi:hypothetical protein